MTVSFSVLLIGDIAHSNAEWKEVGAIANLKEYRTGNRTEFIANCKAGAYDDVVAIYRSNESTKYTGPFDQELVSILPKSLKYICHNGAGYDNIDTDAVTKRGIAVSSTPVAVNDATADIALFLMLGALRRMTVPFMAVRRGDWRGKTELGHDPKAKVLGILGMGGIGQAVATRARAFGMKIQYHNRSPLPADQAAGAKYVDFDTLLRTSDVLSLNLSLNASTRHIISTPEFQKMKSGVIIINTARGPIIDEEALVKALADGKVWSVGLDVYEDEPKVHPELLTNENVVLLPHMGTYTYETQREMELLVLENLRKSITEGKMVTPIPEQKGKL